MSRKQGGTELVIFIDYMETFFSRLSHKPAETTKIKCIKLGLELESQKRLPLSDINNTAILSQI